MFRLRLVCQRLGGQIGQGTTDKRMDPVRCHLGRWNQGKGTTEESGVGQFQLGTAVDHVLSDQKIEIEWSRTPPLTRVAAPSGCCLETLALGEEIP